MIIGISGKAGSGKDTFAEEFRNNIINRDTSWFIKKFSSKLKATACQILGVPFELFENQHFKTTNIGEKWGNMTAREFLQVIGSTMRDYVHKDIWINALFSNYNEVDHYPNWIITDVRYLNEVGAIKKRGGIVIRINRDTGSNDTHVSETQLDNYPFDYVIDNNGDINNLKNEVSKFINWYEYRNKNKM
jgi:dephospho-CoA kinase